MLKRLSPVLLKGCAGGKKVSCKHLLLSLVWLRGEQVVVLLSAGKKRESEGEWSSPRHVRSGFAVCQSCSGCKSLNSVDGLGVGQLDEQKNKQMMSHLFKLLPENESSDPLWYYCNEPAVGVLRMHNEAWSGSARQCFTGEDVCGFLAPLISSPCPCNTLTLWDLKRTVSPSPR